MNAQLKRVVGKVLRAASNTPNFFDFSDAERLNWMIAQAFILGQLSAARAENHRRRKDNQRGEGGSR